MTLSTPEAMLKLSLMNSKAIDLDKIDTIAKLTNMGLPQEIITRIDDLWSKTKEISGQIVHIGKIILAEIMKFISAHPHLAVGVAIGAAIGALTALVPFIGPMLAPFAVVVSTFISGLAGHRLDCGDDNYHGIIGLTQEVIVIAKSFFELFANIFNALQGNVFNAEK
jgi:hypothetical protein